MKTCADGDRLYIKTYQNIFDLYIKMLKNAFLNCLKSRIVGQKKKFNKKIVRTNSDQKKIEKKVRKFLRMSKNEEIC